MKKFILFGSGTFGKEAIKKLGKDKVAFFIDNNETLVGAEVFGVTVCSFEKLKLLNLDDYYLIITTDFVNSISIAEQLMDNKIIQFILYKDLEAFLESGCIDYASYCENSMQQIINHYRKRIEESESNNTLLNEFLQKKMVTVEFYLVDAFEIFHFEPLYNLLREHGIYARFVAEPKDRNTAGGWFDYETAKKILNERNLEYNECCNTDADIAFTTQFSYNLRKYSKAIKINMTYGCSFNKDGFWFQESAMKGFDYKFVDGTFIKDKCLEKNILDEKHIKVIGSPKHYNYHREMFDRISLYQELGIVTNKPVLLYLPTWDEDSSISRFYDEIRLLKEKFFIVTKPHHCTYHLKEKEGELEKLYELSDLVLDGNYDFEKAVMLGDIRICDAKSGAAIESCCLNPDIPTVFLSVRKDISKEFYEEIFEVADAVVNDPSRLYEVIMGLNNKKSIKEKALGQYFDFSVNEERLMEYFVEIIKDNAFVKY